jgi:hypothetical protein
MLVLALAAGGSWQQACLSMLAALVLPCRLTDKGDFWEADEEDSTLERECSAPFFVTPYQGERGTARLRASGIVISARMCGVGLPQAKGSGWCWQQAGTGCSNQ